MSVVECVKGFGSLEVEFPVIGVLALDDLFCYSGQKSGHVCVLRDVGINGSELVGLRRIECEESG